MCQVPLEELTMCTNEKKYLCFLMSYTPSIMCVLVVFCQLDTNKSHLGRGTLKWRLGRVRLTCTHVCGASSCLWLMGEHCSQHHPWNGRWQPEWEVQAMESQPAGSFPLGFLVQLLSLGLWPEQQPWLPAAMDYFQQELKSFLSFPQAGFGQGFITPMKKQIQLFASLCVCICDLFCICTVNVIQKGPHPQIPTH